ncbi:pyruvate kinase [Chytridium lagenaria]|nr:pyruvate kinase [Chytridium lagenaria]
MHPLSFHAASSMSSEILRTKLVCTIGPGKGLNVCRLNLSHCTHEFAKKVIKDLRSYIEETSNTAEVGIWIDINGPKVQCLFDSRDDFYFVNDETLVGDNTRELVKVGDKMFVDDGLLSFTVLERLPNAIRCRVDNSGYLGETSYVIEELPAVSAKDAADISFAISQGVDFISVSCIRTIEDIEEVRMLLGNSKIKLLAKLKTSSILKLADGIVVDRGYLGAEVDVELVTMAQKRMIMQANVTGKSILVANQMLETMKTTPGQPSGGCWKPSLIFYVANAVMDETAVGSYIFEALDTMRRIAYQAEKNTNYLEYQVKMTRSVPKPISVSESIASSAVLSAHQVNASIIVCITELGGTARLVAKYRAQIPVVAATLVRQTARQMASTFGLVPYFTLTVRYAYELGLCKPGDIAVITSGQSVGFLEGTTTKMQLYPVPSFD